LLGLWINESDEVSASVLFAARPSRAAAERGVPLPELAVRTLPGMDDLRPILLTDECGLFSGDFPSEEKGPMHVPHHRVIYEFALIQFLLTSLNGPIEGNLKGMLALYFPMPLLRIFEDVVDLIELLR
jgi:hypothetical protein